MVRIMKKKPLIKRIGLFYLEGFKSMDLGKTLWMIILIKLFVLFVVIKIFFFPRYLNQFDTQTEKEDLVSKELIERALNP